MTAELHSMMDKQLDGRRQRMGKAEAGGDATTLWRLITASLEAAFVKYLGLDKIEAKTIKKEAVLTTQRQDLKPKLKPMKDAKSRSVKWRRRAGKHSEQTNRLQHAAKRMKAVARMKV